MTSPDEQRGGRLKSLDAYVAYLALQHSQDQEAIAAGLALGLYPIWAIQKFTELDRSTPLWLSAALPQVKTAYLQSQRVAAVFADNVRMASLPTEDPLPVALPDVEKPVHIPASRFSLAPRISAPPSSRGSTQHVVTFNDFPISDVAESLVIQGNYEIKAAMPGPEDELMYNGLKNSSGAAIRQAMNGGRNASDNVVRLDRKVIGYARVTDGDPCYFCALLASRGAVYGKGSFVKSDAKFTPNENGPDLPDGYIDVAKVHDHCRCQLRPVYTKSQAMDADARFYKRQWDRLVDNNYGARPDELIQKWRDSYRPYVREEPDVASLRNDLEGRVSALQSAGFTAASPQVEWAQAQLNQLAS